MEWKKERREREEREKREKGEEKRWRVRTKRGKCVQIPALMVVREFGWPPRNLSTEKGRREGKGKFKGK